MPASQLVAWVSLALLVVAGAIVLLAVLRHAPRSRAARRLERGEFDAALDGAGEGPAGRLAAAVAARHLLRLERAAELLDPLLAEDPGDGEVLIERGLVAAHAGDHAAAEAYLTRAAAARGDLVESITLHRAWVTLAHGRAAEALRLFEEVEATLESKLRSELGGEPLFAEWYMEAAALWRAAGDAERAAWAQRAGLAAAPASRLVARLAGEESAAG